MSLIDFPNVPIAPGVPDLRRSAIGIGAVSGVLQKLQRYDIFGILESAFSSPWLILDSNGASVIRPDSVVSFEYRGQERIATHPVEVIPASGSAGVSGSFASYNKVEMPFDIRMRITCNGQGSMTREQFFTTLDKMKKSLDLYTIVTPDFIYKNVNLENVDYRRTAQSGVSLVTCDLWFMEIRVSAQSKYSNVSEPAAAATTNNGTTTTEAPTDNQTSQYLSCPIQ